MGGAKKMGGTGEVGGAQKMDLSWKRWAASGIHKSRVLVGLLKSLALKTVTFTFLSNSGVHKRKCMAVEQKVVVPLFKDCSGIMVLAE